MRTIFALALSVPLLVVALPLSSQEVTDVDRFEMWAECKPMNFRVNTLGGHILNMGPTQDEVVEIIRSRLSDTGLYDPEADTLLYVFLDVFRGIYVLDLSFEKPVEDPITNKIGYASMWDTGAYGGHGYSATYIKSQVSKSMDTFIDEYLRVNADSCA